MCKYNDFTQPPPSWCSFRDDFLLVQPYFLLACLCLFVLASACRFDRFWFHVPMLSPAVRWFVFLISRLRLGMRCANIFLKVLEILGA